jgi:hypothetical protein
LKWDCAVAARGAKKSAPSATAFRNEAMIELCGFPPFPQKKAERMGH